MKIGVAIATPWGPGELQFLVPGVSVVVSGGDRFYRVTQTLLSQLPRSLWPDTVDDIGFGWYRPEEWVKGVIGIGLAREDLGTRLGNTEAALQRLKDGYPDAYEEVFGVVLAFGQSETKDRRQLLARHSQDYIAVSALGDWYKTVPMGHVGVTACRGGDRQSRDRVHLAIPAKEYRARMATYDGRLIGFVIKDVSRYPSWYLQNAM